MNDVIILRRQAYIPTSGETTLLQTGPLDGRATDAAAAAAIAAQHHLSNRPSIPPTDRRTDGRTACGGGACLEMTK